MQLSGTGDKIVNLPTHDSGLMHITGNKNSRFFAIESFDDNNKQIELLVNTTDPYDGVKFLDLFGNRKATRLKVSATGAWSIQIMALSDIRRETIPGKFKGAGDDIIYVSGGTPDIAIIKGNDDARYFAVMAVRLPGKPDLLINTTDPYNGEVMLSTDIVILEVTASGSWEINIKTK